MNSSTAAKIYDWASYIFIIGATVFFFVMKEETQLRVYLTLFLLFIALFMKALMYRSRTRALESDNEELRNDLRRLTALLAEKERHQTNKK